LRFICKDSAEQGFSSVMYNVEFIREYRIQRKNFIVEEIPKKIKLTNL
jgi:hypothetical protein